MGITIKDVEYVLELSRLELGENEKSKFTKQLDNILKYMEQLSSISTKSIEPTLHVIPMKNVYREDEVNPFENIESIIKNMPDEEDRFFRVPKILE